MRCCHSTHSLLFRVLRGLPGGQQQFATQTLRVHLLGLDKSLLSGCLEGRCCCKRCTENRHFEWQKGKQRGTIRKCMSAMFNSVHTRGVVRQVGLQGASVKKPVIIYNLKVFLCGSPREQALLRKSKTSRKSPEKRIFLSLAFYNAQPVCTLLI